MAVRLSALRVGRPLPPRRFLILISVRGCVVIRIIVRPEGVGQLKNRTTSSGIEPAIFRLVDSASTNYATSCPPAADLCNTQFIITVCNIQISQFLHPS
jgi:hypothetical protein